MLLIYKKGVENRIEHDIDSAYGECLYIRHSFMNLTADFINTLQFKQMMNLTVCSFVIISKDFLLTVGEASFLLDLGGSRILGSIGIT